MTDLSSLGATSLGIWTRAQALRLLSVGRYDAAVRSKAWQTVWPGVHADAGYDLAPEQRAFAAVLASGGADQGIDVDEAQRMGSARLRAYACGRLAARVWQFPLVDDDDPATGACGYLHDDVGVLRHLPDLRHDSRVLHHRQLTLRPGDLVRRPSGLWVTSPSRTLSDCAGLLSREAAVCCVDDALHRQVVVPAQLRGQIVATKGHRHGPALGEVVALADGRAEAPSETLMRLLLLPALPGLVPQVELFDQRIELVARFDLGDEAVRLGVEADGKRGHSGAGMVARDRRRDRRSAALGWQTERLTWFDIRRRQAESLARVLTLDAAQRRRWAA